MSRIIQPHIWFFPSNYGDIRLEDAGDDKTRVIWYRLTDQEAQAMAALRKASTHGLRRWVGKSGEIFETQKASEYAIDLKAPLAKVAKVLTKVLRPDRQTVHVMRIGQGKLEEVRTETFDEPEPEPEPETSSDPEGDVTPLREEAPEPEETKEEEETALAKTGTDGTAVAKVTTVKKPVRGCPAPSFESVRLRANRVLRAFLNPDQVKDFERHQRFVTIGADTGHQYMLTSRNAPDELRNFGARCVFDLDENRPYCVHDWDVPAEEELLTLHCLLSLPGYENWARGMPDRDYDPMDVPIPPLVH